MTTIRPWLMLLALLAVALASRSAQAHKPSDAYVVLEASRATVRVRVDVALRDLEPLLALDRNEDRSLTWGEVKSRSADIASYATSRLALRGDDAPCPLGPPAEIQLVDHTDGTYAVLRFDAACPSVARTLAIDYRLFFERDALHRGLVRLEGLGPAKVHVLSSDERSFAFDLAVDEASGFGSAFREGVHHIAEGIDHLLFVLALLLPAVLVRKGRRWEPVPTFRGALFDVARIVTAFTIAHSVTLSLAALGFLRLPSRFVETAIALSVVLAALNNVRPVMGTDRWLAAFTLGLLHGFGFSAVLGDLGLSGENLARTLIGFNLGVEAGQLAFVALVLPLAFAARKSRFYVPLVLRGVSVVIVLVAMAWAIERAFDVTILPGLG